MADINHSILEKVENVHTDATFKAVPNSFFSTFDRSWCDFGYSGTLYLCTYDQQESCFV